MTGADLFVRQEMLIMAFGLLVFGGALLGILLFHPVKRRPKSAREASIEALCRRIDDQLK